MIRHIDGGGLPGPRPPIPSGREAGSDPPVQGGGSHGKTWENHGKRLEKHSKTMGKWMNHG
jgi:hypothetical protein